MGSAVQWGRGCACGGVLSTSQVGSVPRTEFLSSPAAVYRPRRPEHLRQTPPGELGKVIGLDRVPEVRTLREKITLLAKRGDPAAWMRELAKNWMENDRDEAGYLYLDGHARVYHGEQAKLPRRYVSRERLCLRGTTDGRTADFRINPPRLTRCRRRVPSCMGQCPYAG